MPTIADYLTELGSNLRDRLSAINTKLRAKGQTDAKSFDEVPALIEAITTGIDTTITSNAASSSDIRIGKKAYVNGSLVTGSMSTVNVPTPTVNVNSNGVVTASATQSAGYTSGGSKTSNSVILSETHCSTFLEENIADGVMIFGKTGTRGVKYCTTTDIAISGADGSIHSFILNFDADNELTLSKKSSRIKYVMLMYNNNSMTNYEDGYVTTLFMSRSGDDDSGTVSVMLQMGSSMMLFTNSEGYVPYISQYNNKITFNTAADIKIDTAAVYLAYIIYE